MRGEHESEEQSDADHSDSDLYCETCDREFYSVAAYDKHMSEHQTCGIDGCVFTAHEKLVTQHIRLQHSTGLYDRIRNISTPEDIAKWVADRKRNYPSKENVALRYQKQEEMIKRGERIFDKKKKFAEKKTRIKVKKNKPKNRQQWIPKPTVSLINEKSEWNGSMFPFRGTSELYQNESSDSDNFDDCEWNQNAKPLYEKKIKLNNALGALIGAYGSSDESDKEVSTTPQPIALSIDESLASTSQQLDNSSTTPQIDETLASDLIATASCSNSTVTENTSNISDDEIEECSSKIEIDITPGLIQESENTMKPPQTVDSRNKRHRTRKRRHNTNSDAVPKEKVDSFSDAKFKKRNTTLLEKLLQKDINHERNVLLQCVRYVVNNNFFRDDEKESEVKDKEVTCVEKVEDGSR